MFIKRTKVAKGEGEERVKEVKEAETKRERNMLGHKTALLAFQAVPVPEVCSCFSKLKYCTCKCNKCQQVVVTIIFHII